MSVASVGMIVRSSEALKRKQDANSSCLGGRLMGRMYTMESDSIVSQFLRVDVFELNYLYN